MLATMPAAAGVVFVRAGAPANGDGLSWLTAFSDLQSALDAARNAPIPKPEIRIAAGVYCPDGGTGDRAETFDLFDGAILTGGFAGAGTNPDARDPLVHATILSGDIGINGDASDNSRHVVSLRVFSAAASLDGLIVEGGNADGVGFPDGSGGGVLSEGNLTVIDCVFRDNAAESGAGLYSRFGAPEIRHSAFENNLAEKEGGGAYIKTAGSVQNSVFSGNTAAFGGGIAICCGVVEVRLSHFAGNFASFGGGLYSAVGPVRVVGSTFEGNTASKGGGAFTAGTGANLTSCFFGNNTATDGGGSAHSGQLKIVNSVYSRNSALGSGGAIFTDGALTLANSTVARAHALLFGGGLYASGATTTLTNSVLWGNTDSQGSGQNAQLRSLGGSITALHNCVQGWNGLLGGSGNILTAPSFEDPDGPDGLPGTTDDDYRLGADSPCIDAGENALVPPDEPDLDHNGDSSEPTPLDRGGLPRFASPLPPKLPTAIVDIGAHERQMTPEFIPGDANGDGVVDFDDINIVIANWGAENHPADMDGSGTVDFDDLNLVLSNWGGP
jgi:predicted outer membrane repeat protein